MVQARRRGPCLPGQVLALSEELARHGKDEIEALNDALTLDTAIGIALMAELQANIDHLIGAGKVADMRKLTDFRNSVADGLGQIRSAITDSERLVAKAKSLDLIRDEFIREEPEETKRKAPEQFKKDAPRVWEISRTTIRKRASSFRCCSCCLLLPSAGE